MHIIGWTIVFKGGLSWAPVNVTSYGERLSADVITLRILSGAADPRFSGGLPLQSQASTREERPREIAQGIKRDQVPLEGVVWPQ